MFTDQTIWPQIQAENQRSGNKAVAEWSLLASTQSRPSRNKLSIMACDARDVSELACQPFAADELTMSGWIVELKLKDVDSTPVVISIGGISIIYVNKFGYISQRLI